MHRRIIPGIAVCLLVGISGCGSLDLNEKKRQQDAASLADLFHSSGNYLLSSLKSLLRGAAPEEAMDIQTAITLETVRLPANQVADRREFQHEAENLDSLLSAAPDSAPTDSAILAYLANLANGQSASASYLSEAQERTVLKLCGPAHELLPHAAGGDESDSERLLRKSCFTWLVGDSEKSNAMFYLAVAADANVARGTENGFETFLRRLETESDISLFAHRERLKKGPRAELVVDNLSQSKVDPQRYSLSSATK